MGQQRAHCSSRIEQDPHDEEMCESIALTPKRSTRLQSHSFQPGRRAGDAKIKSFALGYQVKQPDQVKHRPKLYWPTFWL